MFFNLYLITLALDSQRLFNSTLTDVRDKTNIIKKEFLLKKPNLLKCIHECVDQSTCIYFHVQNENCTLMERIPNKREDVFWVIDAEKWKESIYITSQSTTKTPTTLKKITTEATTTTTTTTSSPTTTTTSPTTTTNSPATTTTKITTTTTSPATTSKLTTTTTTSVTTTTKLTTTTTKATTTALTTTTSPPVCSTVYYINGNCEELKGLSQVIDEWCESNTPAAFGRFDKKPSSIIFQWRCYDTIALSPDTFFYTQGASLYSRHANILSVIANYPKDYKYFLSNNGQSCATKCTALSKSCSTDVETLNVVYFFKLAGVDCIQNVDRRSYEEEGGSFWRHSDEPYFDGNTNTCFGFINVQTFDCTKSTSSERQRLCRCV